MLKKSGSIKQTAFFYLIRHGETKWNAEKRLTGRSNVSLSDVGRRQAKSLAARLKSLPVDSIYCSPLRRTMETAIFIGDELNINPIQDIRIIEMSYGSWEGKMYSEIVKNDSLSFSQWNKDPYDSRPPGGENGREATKRGMDFMNFLKNKHRTGNVLVVSHRTICRLIISYVLGINQK